MIYGRNLANPANGANTPKVEEAPAAPAPCACAPDRSKLVNPNIKKDQEKVPTLMEFDEIQAKAKDGNVCLCRCWRSAKFPFCDGTHLKYNKETGDNVAPFVIKKVVVPSPVSEQAMGA